MFEKFEEFFKRKQTPINLSVTCELFGTQVAILATDGFEPSELLKPKEALERAGAIVRIVSPRGGKIRGFNGTRWTESVDVDLTILEAFAVEFDFLVLPGGVINPDKLRSNADAVAFALSFVNKKLPIAAICHGVQTLIETGYVNGKTMTSWPSLKTDLVNAGAKWVDREVVVDHKLITSRKPADIMAFNEVIIREFSLGLKHRTMPNTEGYAVTL